mmetsp:Transcript_79057/g.245556  ORF Transcript_79057/g.245556 Transcript_79057/m.245556 type:complete len:108 (+) Transcript_79057:93-416(+)
MVMAYLLPGPKADEELAGAKSGADKPGAGAARKWDVPEGEENNPFDFVPEGETHEEAVRTSQPEPLPKVASHAPEAAVRSLAARPAPYAPAQPPAPRPEGRQTQRPL